MKIVSLEEIDSRIKNKYPNQPFKIINYTRVSKPFTILCLNCNRERTYSSFNNYFNSKRKNLCDCYNKDSNYNSHLKSISQVEKIIQDDNDIQFIQYWYKKEIKKNMIEVKCCKCNQNYSKPIIEFIKNKNCPFCIGKELLNTQAVKSLLPEQYSLLSEYESTNKPVLIQHDCGFIWKTKVKTLYNRIGCPRCNKKRSQGEQKIENYLIKKEFSFLIEHSFDWQKNPRRRYDFYLPDYNLIIEYNGEQHYLENKYFKVPLKEQQKIDKEKEEEAKVNGYNYLIIGYFDFTNIETILDNWFNDYSNRKQI